MFVRIYNTETDELIPRDGRSDHWDMARVPGIDESLVLWINEDPVSFIVDDVLTELDKNRVNYSLNVTPLKSLTEKNEDATASPSE